MTSPGGRIEIRVDPDLKGFGAKLSSGLSSAASSGVSAFASAAKVALVGAAVGISAAAIVATKSTLDIGMAYQDQLNTLQAVSGATEAQMAAVGKTAKALGSDLTLPATSAADAAAVMTELAKASFSVDEAQQAAKGSLQLAAAAQIDGARAAEIQANAINAFGLAATDATRVADVLANAANASSAEITDVADALAQAAAVAATAHISIEDTATALGLLANNGIKGSDAGTLLKSALLALQSPSKQARQAMDDLNLTAYDSQGNFVGLRSIFEQLAKAQGTMSQEAYEAATSTLFGSDAARLAGIAAREGAGGWDEMAAAIGRQGAAADVAAAKSKGLRGAIEAFKSQVETVQIDVFERAAPGLERLVRLAADRLPDVANAALDTVDRTVTYFQNLAPRIGQALQARRDAVVAAWHQLGEPLVEGAKDLADKGLDVIVKAVERVGDTVGHAVDVVEPLAKSVGHLASSLAQANGPLETAGDLIGVAAKGADLALDAIGPLVHVASTAVDVFSALPGPLQSVVLGLAALKVASKLDIFDKLASSDGRVRSSLGNAGQSVIGFAQTVRTNMKLAGDDVGVLERTAGGMSAGFQRYFPTASATVTRSMGEIRTAFAEAKRDARFDVAEQFGTSVRDLPKATGDIRGLSAAAKTAATQGIGALKSAGSGLVSFLGGPWGAALAGVTIGVGLFESAIQAATNTEQGWVEALKQGGAAATQATKEMSAASAKAQEFKSSFAGSVIENPFSGLLPGLSAAKVAADEAVPSAQDARKAYNDWYDGLSKVDQAQEDVTQATAKLNEQVGLHGASSLQAAEAAQALKDAEANLAVQQQVLSTAAQSTANALHAQAQAALAGANADIAASQANQSLQTAISQYQQVMADATATDQQKQQATDAVAASSLNAAQAAAQAAYAHSTATTEEGKQAEADAALLASLQATAQQLGSNTPAAVTNLIASLSASASTANATASQMTGLGLSVLSIPDQRSVIINAPTADQKKRLEDLGYVVQNIPGTNQARVIKIDADTSSALSQLTGLYNFINAHRTAIINTTVVGSGTTGGSGSSKRLATGGPIVGPGTWTSDSIQIWASNGEYMHQAAAAAALGRGTEDALNRMDWRAALPRIQELAAQQSRAVLASATVARQAGHFAAGGYISAQDRATGIVAGPQRVTNMTNILNAAPNLPTTDQLQRMIRENEILARADA